MLAWRERECVGNPGLTQDPWDCPPVLSHSPTVWQLSPSGSKDQRGTRSWREKGSTQRRLVAGRGWDWVLELQAQPSSGMQAVVKRAGRAGREAGTEHQTPVVKQQLMR